MKLLVFLPFILTIFAEEVYVKSLKIYNNQFSNQFPVIIQKEDYQEKFTVEFDLACENIPNIALEFKFCDRNWKPVTSLFLTNNGYDKDGIIPINTINPIIHGAKFYCKESYPNDRVNFPFSGKWLFYIIDKNKNQIIAEGRFIVVIPEVELTVEKSKNRISSREYDLANMENTVGVKVMTPTNENYVFNRIDEVEIIENFKSDYPYTVTRTENSINRFYEPFSSGNNLSFTIRDIRPGNGYRVVDIRQPEKYNYPNTQAHFNGRETSRFFEFNDNDHDGSFFISQGDNSDYLKVEFSLDVKEEKKKSVFLTGSFVDWLLLPELEMKYQNDSYSTNIELRRGVYDYQFVTGEYNKKGEIVNIDWYKFEGNYINTKNVYHIFMYYSVPEKEGYDKIIGYEKIISGKYEQN